MQHAFDKINKIEDTNELTDMYFEIFNFENKLTEDDLSLQFDCFRLKSVIKERIETIITNKGLVGVS